MAGDGTDQSAQTIRRTLPDSGSPNVSVNPPERDCRTD
jgi:hypothetical protein